MLHTLDCIRPAGREQSAAELARRAVEVSQDDGVTSVLVALQRARSQMAVVTDADGHATGIVTVKDLVEEIVGELQDF
jgi:CBS domain containing-hemolysin-like protein